MPPGYIPSGSLLRGGRGSRLISASPLAGRSQPFLLEDDALAFENDENNPSTHFISDADNAELGDAPNYLLDELHEKDSRNFFGHVQEALLHKQEEEEQRAEQLGATADKITDILFEELIKPAECTKQVAAAAFLHSLTLANRRLIALAQDRAEDPYGPIMMRLL